MKDAIQARTYDSGTIVPGVAAEEHDDLISATLGFCQVLQVIPASAAGTFRKKCSSSRKP